MVYIKDSDWFFTYIFNSELLNIFIKFFSKFKIVAVKFLKYIVVVEGVEWHSTYTIFVTLPRSSFSSEDGQNHI